MDFICGKCRKLEFISYDDDVISYYLKNDIYSDCCHFKLEMRKDNRKVFLNYTVKKFVD